MTNGWISEQCTLLMDPSAGYKRARLGPMGLESWSQLLTNLNDQDRSPSKVTKLHCEVYLQIPIAVYIRLLARMNAEIW